MSMHDLGKGQSDFSRNQRILLEVSLGQCNLMKAALRSYAQRLDSKGSDQSELIGMCNDTIDLIDEQLDLF